MPWRRRLRRLLIQALIAYVGVMVLMMMLENWFVYHPIKASQHWEPPPTPELQDVSLASADGTRLHAWWLPCPGAKSALLYLHGNAGNLSHRGRSAVKLREVLGVSVLLLDYPGYGKCEGRPSEHGCYQTADAGYQWLVDEKKIAPKNVLIYGKSLGGAVAVDLASRREHRALIVIKSFTSAPDVGSQLFWWLPVRWIMRNRFPSVEKIGQCRRPIFMAHGDADEVVPFALGKKLYEAAGEPKQFHVIPGATHNEPIPDGMFDELKGFLDKHASVK